MVEKAGIEPTFTGSGPVSLPLTDFSIYMVESVWIEHTFTGSKAVSLPLTELSMLSVFYPGPDFLAWFLSVEIVLSFDCSTNSLFDKFPNSF